MREIKFRAWEKKSLVMRFWDYLKDIDYTRQFSLFEDSGFVFMQYTGLLDRNGKEIYEGDIVTHNIYTKQSGRNEQSKPKVVFWDKEKCGFETNERESYSAGMFYSEYTIIGNIHQNPELLK